MKMLAKSYENDFNFLEAKNRLEGILKETKMVYSCDFSKEIGRASCRERV